jgi:hypothetical protein
MNISNAIFQLGNIHQLPSPMGTDKARAVKADNCWGERLLVENMGSISFSKDKGKWGGLGRDYHSNLYPTPLTVVIQSVFNFCRIFRI